MSLHLMWQDTHKLGMAINVRRRHNKHRLRRFKAPSHTRRKLRRAIKKTPIIMDTQLPQNQ